MFCGNFNFGYYFGFLYYFDIFLIRGMGFGWFFRLKKVDFERMYVGILGV